MLLNVKIFNIFVIERFNQLKIVWDNYLVKKSQANIIDFSFFMFFYWNENPDKGDDVSATTCSK